MNKYEFLRWLDDPDIKEKILKIVAESKKFPEPEEKFLTNDNELDNLRGENSRLENDLSEAKQRVNDLERQIKSAQYKNSRLENDLASSQQRVKDLEQQIQNAQYRNSRLENSLSQSEQSSRALKNKLEEWQRTFNSEQQRANNLQRELDAANDKISELNSLLQARFAHGWELFQKYQSVGSHTRQLLQGVFPHENFTSFICGGAQVNSLETLWEVLRECVMNRRQQDAEILGEIFEYCLELVNASKAQASYSILPVNVGDRFDSDVHIEAPGSRAQGTVAAIYLPGYRNDYSGKIIKKSIVQVS